jgi:hypothetical protein
MSGLLIQKGNKMIEELENKSESDLIKEIAGLPEAKIDQVTAEIYLTGTMESLKSGDQDIEIAAPMLRSAVLQRVTRDEGRRGKAVELTIQLLGQIGEREASYLSNYLSDMEADFRKEGRSWFEKKIQLTSELTNLSGSLDRKGLTKEADEVDSFVKEFAAQDD